MATAGMLIATIALAEDFPLPCKFVAADPQDLGENFSCAVRKNGAVTVSKAALAKMYLNQDGLAQALIDHSWYYIKRDGATLPVITFDNGADYFSEGLVRSRVGGKIAYFDAQFKQVIPPKYDWGWPFEDGKALVCIGCAEGVRDGEGHSKVEGGRWGYIDRNGREVVNVTHLREELIK